MKFENIFINYAPIHLAVDKRRFDTVQLLLEIKQIDVNITTISNHFEF